MKGVYQAGAYAGVVWVKVGEFYRQGEPCLQLFHNFGCEQLSKSKMSV